MLASAVTAESDGKNMKRIWAFLLIMVFIAMMFAGCGSLDNDNGKIKIVCTTFSAYDWVTEIIQGSYYENFEVTLLGGNGDLHSYQPTAQDIALIQKCDLFIYVGGVSDGWTKDVLKNSNVKTLRLFDVLEGSLLCGDHGHGEHNHKIEEYDEHIWLSLRMASVSVDAIFEKVIELVDENNSGELVEYSKNKEYYKWRLEELDKEYRRVVEQSENKTIVFADRFPFLYLTEEYGIDAVAAFPGCSADSNATFEVVAHLAETVDRLDKKTVLVLEKSKQSVANTVIQSTKSKNAKIEVMNSCQTIGQAEVSQGVDYLDIMEKNLDALKQALE